MPQNPACYTLFCVYFWQVHRKKSPSYAFRNDAWSKVAGRTCYTDDLVFARMAHAVPVYTDYFYADKLQVDMHAALHRPGVLSVLTAADVSGKNRYGQIEQDYTMFAEGRSCIPVKQPLLSSLKTVRLLSKLLVL